MKVGIALVTAAAGAVLLAGAATASALPNPYEPVPVDPNQYLVGDTAYFDLGDGTECAIYPTGNVGCAFPQPIALTITGSPVRPMVTNLVIDVPWLPAHPEPGFTGRSGSRQLGVPVTDANGNTIGWRGAEISYAGASCGNGGERGGWGCSSKGHHFGGGNGYYSAN
ncbi:hypothetical protein FOS14_12640 [Skermania sp. ID1734]|uniref:hypothetical protein n=1 Tax=Skermania sp. ID1734 TaxID=2597516 RepID=UPI00117D16F3|nr:hypothetical protein [Skermania sp. ID1734]TSD99208.1 hypothetical protein FOS14_12640 [Skermania sp. ID1734]